MNNPIDESILFFLKDHSSLFYSFLNDVAYPVFSDDIKTAAVFFDSDNKNFRFEINFSFWDKLNFFSKCFVISHEILHVFLKHGSRGKSFLESLHPDKRDYETLNIAQDISINEMLLKEFHFDLSFLNFDFKPCFVDTVFNDQEIKEYNIKKNESFYFYFEILSKLNKKNNTCTIDNHDGFNEIENPDIDNIQNNESELPTQKKTSDEIVDNLLEDHDDFFNNVKNKENDSDTYLVDVKKEKSIDEIFHLSIKKSLLLSLKKTNSQNWYGYDRRTSDIINQIDPSLTVPIKSFKTKNKFNKHKILAYLDVSGSCKQYSTELIHLLFNLPSKKYECTVFSFSDRVSSQILYTNKKNIKFENTGFSTNIKGVLEHSNLMIQNTKFDAIFFVTDALFTYTKKENYNSFLQWFFFIIPNNNSYFISSIPKETKNIFYLPKI